MRMEERGTMDLLEFEVGAMMMMMIDQLDELEWKEEFEVGVAAVMLSTISFL